MTEWLASLEKYVVIPIHSCGFAQRVSTTTDHRMKTLTQICLHTDHVNSKLCGINSSDRDSVLDDAGIDEMQKLCFNLGQYMMLRLDLSANTKLHKPMRHIADTINDHGSTIWSTNHLYETMHKNTKHAFKNTNKRQDLLHEQLMYKRIASMECRRTTNQNCLQSSLENVSVKRIHCFLQSSKVNK